MLTVQNLTKRFATTTAVDNANLEIKSGQFLGIIGRSGAGKSTMLRMINRLETPTSGAIMFDGVDVAKLQGRELRQWRRRCAMIFQQFNLVGRLDVLTNVLTGRLGHTGSMGPLLRMWGRDDKAIALAALEQFDIASLAGQRVDQL